MSLRATGVTVRYDGAAVPALDAVSFALGRGELVAIGGPNGSGKTSLLRALLGLVPLRAGSVTLDDTPVAAWPRRALAGAIAALPQREEPAFPLTVYDAVLLGRWAHLGPVAPVRPADEAAIADAMSRCDVAGLGHRGIETLSGGEWQRVRVARALAASPRLLLLDEPTAALDVGHEMALFELLRSLVADGLGVLVITHQLNLAARFADRVLLLDGGRAVAEGTPRDVLRADRLSMLFGWPVAVEHWHDGSPLMVPLRSGESPRGPLAHLPPSDEFVP
ncbi:MAG: ABC transporter ATP-binding protein [Gemmatimonadota bacterium]